jgi:Fe-Mn family superoxide dismutase
MLLRRGSMNVQQPTQEYIKEVLEWSQLAKLKGQSYLQQFEPQHNRAGYSKWETDISDFIEEMEKAQEGSSARSITEQDVDQIQARSERLYKDWLSLLKNEAQAKIEPTTNEPQNNNSVPFQSVPIGGHQLPPLPYSYDALEPYIDEEIMELHHMEHHQSYVDGLNKAERKMAESRKTGDYELIRHWEREAAFHGAGHYLHTIFWNIMSPEGGGNPTGDLAKQINQDFGSFEKFKKHFSEAANQVEGVGWAILIWSPRSHRLEILQAEKHQLLSQWDVIPLLVLDVWEHAYYLQYNNNRGEYVDNWWNVVDWTQVGYRFNEAKKLRWQPY